MLFSSHRIAVGISTAQSWKLTEATTTSLRQLKATAAVVMGKCVVVLTADLYNWHHSSTL
jgi:hypothetical protein